MTECSAGRLPAFVFFSIHTERVLVGWLGEASLFKQQLWSLLYLRAAQLVNCKSAFSHVLNFVARCMLLLFFLNNTPSLFVGQLFYSRGDRKA
jgi:hypothetical protein